jgi:hypothetical protein
VAEVTEATSYEHVDWSLDRSARIRWEVDGVHFSCDPARYDPRPDGWEKYPDRCKIDAAGSYAPRGELGAEYAAARVKSALQGLQRRGHDNLRRLRDVQRELTRAGAAITTALRWP